jgi:Protein phosphatase 2C
MNTKGAASAAVTGARHLRVPRNGQDAAAAWVGDGRGAVVVCDGCSAGAHSEVGARLVAQLVISKLARAQGIGEDVFVQIRREVAAEIGRLVEAMPGDRPAALNDHFLCTIVAAVWSGDEVAVWALGDGAYAIGDHVTVLGPFADNMPPYLAYDVLGEPQPAHYVRERARSVLVATDGVAEIGVERFLAFDRYLANPDALRRQLAIAARSTERVDFAERRIVRAPAALQDDGAIALARWS